SPMLFLLLFTSSPPPALSTLSLHDALPICPRPKAPHDRMTQSAHTVPVRSGDVLSGPLRHVSVPWGTAGPQRKGSFTPLHPPTRDRKSTRLNSSHVSISYAVFCLKKKKKNT